MVKRQQESLQNADDTLGERRGLRFRWKRIVLAGIILSVLTFGLFYYAFPTIFHPLRIDAIPAGAYVVPWMRPSPSIDELALVPTDSPPWDVDVVMNKALKLTMNFSIDVPNSTQVVSSAVYLGHDGELLYIGGKFEGMYGNPVSDPQVEILPNFLDVFFDVANDGRLSFPESGSRLSVFLSPNADWHTGKLWGYHDLVWLDYVEQYERQSWIMAENYYEWNLHKAQPVFGIENVVLEYDNSTGTLIILFSRYLQRPQISEVDGLQMRPGERWVMGFLLELGYATHISAFGDYVDGWPQNIYPYVSNDSLWWPKFAIDLSNQPVQYPGGPSTPLTPLATAGTSNNQPLYYAEASLRNIATY